MADFWIPLFTMLGVQMCYAVLQIQSKLAIDSGMNPYILVAYRQLIGTAAIVPLAYYMERTRPTLTVSILFKIFLCSIGVTTCMVTYLVGLKHSTPTIACAISNITPAITFILAVLFRLEKLRLKMKIGQAKVFGTIMCVGGALLLSFYHGHQVNIGESNICWKYALHIISKGNLCGHENFFLGPFLIIISGFAWAGYLILQTKVIEIYDAPYSNTSLMFLMASVECVIIALCFEHKDTEWALTPSIRGIVCTTLTFCLVTWCIKRKGPLFVSIFSPVLMIMVAILSWALFREKLYVGTIIGSVLIMMGIYAVLWGQTMEKREEEKRKVTEEENTESLKYSNV